MSGTNAWIATLRDINLVLHIPSNTCSISIGMFAVWYFEDVLQVRPLYLYIQKSLELLHSVPCQSLRYCFPPSHDESTQPLLFQLAEWHTLAKLHLHTEEILTLLHQALHWMSDQLHKFKEQTYSKFNISKLPQEATQRKRREVTGAEASTRKQLLCSGRLPITFNLNTYKTHALGIYKRMIRSYGTTNSYNTQVVQ